AETKATKTRASGAKAAVREILAKGSDRRADRTAITGWRRLRSEGRGAFRSRSRSRREAPLLQDRLAGGREDVVHERRGQGLVLRRLRQGDRVVGDDV